MFLRLPPVSALFNFVAPLQAWNAYHTPTDFFQSGGVRLVPISQLASYKSLGEFARAAYCLNGLQTWTCGPSCDANPDFQLTLRGDKRFLVHDFFVGYSPSLSSIIVSHEGTDPTQISEFFMDADKRLDRLDATLFPGANSDVKVHSGFRNEHAVTASVVFNEVKRLMVDKKTKNITIVGHSMGGALAELEALSLVLRLPSLVNIRTVVFGTPRVGNPAYAKFFDSQVPNFKRINNKRDIVPIVPGRSMGYLHPQGEIHLLGPGFAVSCPGNDNAVDMQCQVKSVPNLLAGHFFDHLGPYEGVSVGIFAC